MARMTGGEALVKQLYREGVHVVFGLPGVQLYGAVVALRDEPGIRFVVTRHEQATSYMADGYARAGSTFGTALVVPGPGLLNASAGLSTAYAASSPVLMIAGQIPKAQLGKNIGVLHEVNDQLDAIAPITKWRRRVLEAVAEYLQAGVVQSAEGKGALGDASDLSLGAALWPQSALRRYFEAADAVLVVGSRLALAAPKPEQQVIQLDVDGEEIGRNHKKTFGLVGDARATLAELLERLRAAAPPRRSRKAEREALRAEIAASMSQEPNTSILRSLRAGAPEDAIVVAGMTQIGYYSRPFWPVYQPRTYLTSSYSGNLGYEYPTALGAKVACPKRPVIAICGDGGFLYNSQELATAVLHRINVIAVVFNDNAYGNVARDLDEAWGGSYAAELHNPDFMKLADAYGVAGMRAKTPTDVGALVRDAIQLDRPVLIAVPLGRVARPPLFALLRAPMKYKR